MRIATCRLTGQVFLLICALILCACGGRREDSSVIPPATSPLSRDYIGFGVINVSYTHVSTEPAENGASLGYLRRGSVVRVIERRSIRDDRRVRSWVLTEGNHRGWLREEVMDIYDNESQAKTASEFMSR